MELPIIGFIKERLAESDTTLETRAGTAFYDLFIKPQELMLDPLLSAMEVSLVAQSVRRILLTDDPDAFNENSVDDIAANVYVVRDLGGKATTTVRVFYSQPLDKEFPALTAEVAVGNGVSFFNSEDILISSAEMALNISGSLFFMDFPVIAEAEGSEYNVPAGDITVFVNDPDAVSVTNLSDAIDGLPKETNTQLLNRSKNSIGVRDLETIKGINAIIRENFPFVGQIQAIGFGDPEMMRDILFNAHVGGKTDIYLKTPALQTKSTKFVGLDFDSTREISRSTNRELLASSASDPLAPLGTPLIVVGSLDVKEDVIETAASIISASVPATIGIDLSTNEWIKLQINGGTPINIKISGATPTQTQRFEIINSINATLGKTLVQPYGTDKMRLASDIIGAGSQIVFMTPDTPRTDGTLILFPAASAAGYVPTITDGVIDGVVAIHYVETVDYSVDYTNGLIWKLPGSAIRSGDTVDGPALDGAITSGSHIFQSPNIGEFTNVRVGDELVITASTGIATGSYFVTEVQSDQALRIQSFTPTSSDSAVEYYIKSHQVVVISYLYNPLSVDIGPQVVLTDGITRGIRPGRENFTITDVPFIDIISIEEIDPDTQEGLGVFLTPPGGYGVGGYGSGGYGTGAGTDYEFRVNKPPERFSVYEDSMILFNASLFGKSYEVTYYCAPEILAIHNLSRNDLERVTGADVLPKNFVPGFVDMAITIRRDPTNISALTTDELQTAVANYVESTEGVPIEASQINAIIENGGAKSVKDPFTMQLTVINTDGSSSIYFSQDLLEAPDVVLPRETSNFVTPRIIHVYPRNIILTEEV